MSREQAIYIDRMVGRFQSEHGDLIDMAAVSSTSLSQYKRFPASSASKPTAKAASKDEGAESSVSTVPTKDYIDARLGEAAAVHKSDLAQVLAKLDVVASEVRAVQGSAIKRSELYGVAIGIVGILVAALIGIATLGADRFSAGMSISPIIQQTIAEQSKALLPGAQAQLERDAKQDQRLDQVLQLLENMQPPKDQ